MSTETQVSPGAETQNPAPETEKPEVVTQEAAEVEASAEGEAHKALDPEQMRERMQKRIDRKHALAARAIAENEQLKRELEGLRSGKPEETRESNETDPRAIAREIARVERFNDAANKLVSDGVKKHTDYRDALEALAKEVGPFVVRDLPSPFMEAVLEVSEKPTELLYYLGKNPEVAEELADLSPMKLAKRLDRIEREMSESSKTKASSAPKPLQEVRGAAGGSRALADLEDKDFVKRRREQIANRR